jgi:hypothetical protein
MVVCYHKGILLNVVQKGGDKKKVVPVHSMKHMGERGITPLIL